MISDEIEIPVEDDRWRSSARDFPCEINDLADVMVGVSGHAQKQCKASVRARLGRIEIGLLEITGGLCPDRGGDHVDGTIEICEHLLFGQLGWIRKFEGTISDIARARDVFPDVMVQVTGQVQNEVTNAVSVRIGFAPDVLG